MTAVRLWCNYKQNLAEAQNHTLCMSIGVLYPHLSQGECVAPLVYSQHKLDSMVEMKKQGVIEVKKVTIKKEGKLIETNTYIMTFDQPKYRRR